MKHKSLLGDCCYEPQREEMLTREQSNILSHKIHEVKSVSAVNSLMTDFPLIIILSYSFQLINQSAVDDHQLSRWRWASVETVQCNITSGCSEEHPCGLAGAQMFQLTAVLLSSNVRARALSWKINHWVHSNTLEPQLHHHERPSWCEGGAR